MEGMAHKMNSCTLAFNMWSRKQEVDPGGRPALRYSWTPYPLLAAGAVWFGVAAYQWFDPDNHRYPGNLLLLSCIPAAIGVLSFCLTWHLVRYHVIPTGTAIEVYRWPFAMQTYRLCDLDGIENRGLTLFSTFWGKRNSLFMGYILVVTSSCPH